MNVKKILKILGFITVPVLPMVIAMYFLFPYLNEEKYREISSKYEDNWVLGDSSDVELIGEDFATLKERSQVFQENISELKQEIDSLKSLNDSLSTLVMNRADSLRTLKNLEQNQDGSGEPKQETAQTEQPLNEEELRETVKTLLSMEDENLAPILKEMGDRQILLLYKAGNSLERKKLLRALDFKRAANLMTEVL